MGHSARQDSVGLELTRRSFIGFVGATLAGKRVCGAPMPSQPLQALSGQAAGDSGLSALPDFCAHEHWGSIGSIGQFFDGFRADAEAGALPARRTTLCDVLLDPYFGGWVRQAGTSIEEIAKKAGETSFEELARAGTTLALGETELRRAAAGFLNDNAAAVYGIGVPHRA